MRRTGVCFVVHQIDKADEVFRDLNALMPGKVAIWTSDHDAGCKTPKRIENPSAKFERAQLRFYPVIVVTHNFYLDKKDTMPEQLFGPVA